MFTGDLLDDWLPRKLSLRLWKKDHLRHRDSGVSKDSEEAANATRVKSIDNLYASSPFGNNFVLVNESLLILIHLHRLTTRLSPPIIQLTLLLRAVLPSDRWKPSWKGPALLYPSGYGTLPVLRRRYAAWSTYHMME